MTSQVLNTSSSYGTSLMKKAQHLFTSSGPVLALAILLASGAALSENFLTQENLTNVLTRSSVIGIIAIGATFVITAGGLDLSVGSLAALVAGLTIVVTNYAAEAIGVGIPALVAGFVFTLAAGALAGLINGALIVRGGVEAFIVTLGAMGIFRSLLTWLADGGSISLDYSLRTVARPVYYGELAGIATPILVFLLLVVGGELLLKRMRFGRHVAAIGSNRQVALYSGIAVDRIRILTYVIQGLMVAIATVIYVPRLGTATPATGLMWELEAIAAVIIGGTALGGGFGRVWGTVVGVLILGLISNILNLTGVFSPHLNGAFQGAIIIVAVFLQRERSRG